MDATPFLARLAKLLKQHQLEAILIGNAAAALQAAPVTTIDIDFLFRKTPTNVKKLKAVARDLGAVILRPYYPVSGLYRLCRDEDDLQLDFMTSIAGIRSFEGLRKRAERMRFGDAEIYVASLSDIIKSKQAAGRAKDLAVLDSLKETLHETSGHKKGKAGSSQEGE